MQEYYKILGVSEESTNEEIELAYRTLKEKYSRERFYEGEVGNEAARMLTKIETAYHEIIEERNREKKINDRIVNDYSDVEGLIKKGDISDAQELLDNYADRDAEWHYLQSVVFYKKNWMNESKKQLEIAVNMDPHNSKYGNAYAKLKQKIEYNDAQFRSGNMGGQPQGEPQRQMGADSNGCLSFCTTWCCMNLMCNICCR
jgi:curved DNA-binding protein CbpA